MDFAEFEAVYKAYAEQRDFEYKDCWERMRLLATITIQPHIAKNKKITPEKLLPFPWDKQKGKRANAKAKDITPAQQSAHSIRFLYQHFLAGITEIFCVWQEKAPYL